MSEFSKTDHLIHLMSFLLWYEREDPGVMWGGVTIDKAIAGVKSLLNMSDDMFDELKRITLGDEL